MSGWSLAGFLPLLVTSAVAAAQGAVPTVLPTLETRPVIDVGPEDGPAGTRLGDADDPAVWLHPTDPARSLVAGTLKDGGLDIYNLRGEVVQSLSPAGVRYNNVDVLYGFPLAGRAADLFVASDRYRDVLAVYAVDPATLRVRDVTDPAGPLIYTEPGGEPDGETTAYGLAAYYDPEADGFYAFVSRRETNEVAQLRLTGRGGAVGWEVVRRLSLTLPERYGGDNPQVEGMVVDAELGVAYLAQEQVGIWKVALGGGAPELSYPLDGEVLTADAEGLTIYYGPNGSGYLLVVGPEPLVAPPGRPGRFGQHVPQVVKKTRVKGRVGKSCGEHPGVRALP